jgi:hypothetical protein
MASKKKNVPAPKLNAKLSRDLTVAGWENVGGGTAESLGEGDMVTGVFRGVEDTNFKRDDGEPARVIVIETDGSTVHYWAPTVLQSRVESITPGDEVRIECLGKSRTGAGRMAWMFDVRVKRHSPARLASAAPMASKNSPARRASAAPMASKKH